ncbi:atypical/ABC1/ABC1-B protein kinase, variant [Allomyces macrogynus ATCC 38327]|uniref:Atypical/ABC1/ABC1-B protein kinase, variant n=1 Tax=Allomyces macrogynus (strain ATCC 38327) TaxID=578462 RepID=A0A0L0T902_ALLM3|nr:atypical/ABC1/ABC1-B protein kinase, variant [Allomyces macrogynus ATCC 38327]|eukprot:KNE71196.1 atypical/ABC1/ABC1-B protein kinase, variant [Allomyces macrogynus ATCC 38327]
MFARALRRTVVASTVLFAGSAAGSLYLSPEKDLFFLAKATSRSLRTVTTGVAVVADYQWSLRSSVTEGMPRDDYVALKSDIHLRCAKRMLCAIQKNGGVYVKLGQHVSALEYLLPAEYVETMRVLQDQCPPSSLEDINKLFETDLGVPMKYVFASFDEEPIGVASIAQVHRARLQDGRDVAIKIQHPGIRTFSMLDIELTAGFVKMVKQLFPDFEFGWLADEMRNNLPCELDFNYEAKNAEIVESHFRGSDRLVTVPKVYWVKPRLMCMEFVEGKRIDDLDYLREHHIDPSQVAVELNRIFSEMIFYHGFLHSDPHPGNLMIQPQPVKTPVLPLFRLFRHPRNFKIILLDHGLYRTLDKQFRHDYAWLWESLIRGDEDRIRYWSKQVAEVDMYELFACMITGRNWDTITSGGVKSDRRMSELDNVTSSAAFYFKEISSVLAQVPRPLLLVFKTNDLLRSVARSLKLSEWASVSVMSMYVLETCALSGEVEGVSEWARFVLERVLARVAVWLYEHNWL